MSKDVHNMDEIFRSAYEEFEDEPSGTVWDKISAGLDKKEAASYKRISRNWKRIAIVALFLLFGFTLYEVNVMTTRSAESRKNILPDEQPKSGIPFENKEEANNIKSSSRNRERESRDAADKNISANSSVPITENGLSNVGLARKTKGGGSIANTQNSDVAVNHLNKRRDVFPGTGDERDISSKSYVSVENIRPSLLSNVDFRKASLNRAIYSGPVDLNFAAGLPSQGQPKATTISQRGKSAWTLTFLLSTDRVGYRLDKDRPTITRIKQHEEHRPSLSGGILIGRQLGGKIGIQAGLIYSNIAIAISPQKIYASQNQGGAVSYKYVTSSGYAYIKPGFASPPSAGDSLNAENAQHGLRYIIVPLMVKARLLNTKKWILSPGLGFAGNFLTGARIETDVEKALNHEHVLINKLNGIRSFNWSAVADASLEYSVNRKISLNFHPFFAYALSPITRNNDVETFPYTLGIGAGATYRF